MKRAIFYLLSICIFFSVSGEKCWEKLYSFNSNTFTTLLGDKYIFVGAEYSNSSVKWNYFQTDKNGELEWDSTAYTSALTDSPIIVATQDSGYMVAGLEKNFKFWKYNKQHKLTNTTTIICNSGYNKKIYSLLPSRDNNIIAIVGSELTILKLNQNGDSLWQKKYNDYYAGPGLVKIDSEVGGYYCTATKDGVNLLLKFSENGDIVWEKAINGYSYLDTQPSFLTASSDGSFLVTFGGYMTFYKMDNSGNIIWTKSYSDIGINAYCSAVTATHDGGFITANDVCNNFYSPTIYLMKLNAKGDTTFTVRDKRVTLLPHTIIEDKSDSTYVFQATTLNSDDSRVYKFDSTCHVISAIDETEYYAKKMTCYPNPFKKSIGITLSQHLNKLATVEIFNSSGQLVLSNIITIGTDNIKTKVLPLGIYFLRLTVDKETFSSKLVKVNY